MLIASPNIQAIAAAAEAARDAAIVAQGLAEAAAALAASYASAAVQTGAETAKLAAQAAQTAAELAETNAETAQAAAEAAAASAEEVYNAFLREYQAETNALVARFATVPTWQRKLAIDNLILALKNATIWDKLDVLWVPAAANEQAALLNWKEDTFPLVTTGHAPTFTADSGYAGNGSSTYLDTGWDPSTNGVNFTLNDASAWVVSLTDTADDGWELGDLGSAPHVRMRVRSSTNTFVASINDGTGTHTVTSGSGVGLFGITRQNPGKEFWINGVYRYPALTTSAATALTTTDQWLCGASPNGYGTKKVGFAAFGASLDGLEAQLYEAVRVYFNALGHTLDVDYGAYPSVSGSAVTVTSDGKHNGFPGLARLSNGTLVAVYRSGTSHTAAGTIVQKLSTDEGQTWGAATTIVSTTDSRDPEITLLSNGRLLMSYFRTIASPYSRTVYVKHGTVSGSTITWGDSIEVSHGFNVGDVACSSKPIQLASGRVLLPMYGEEGSNTLKYSSGVAISDDYGLTWTSFAIVGPGSDATGADYNESNGVQFSDGEIYMMMRSQTSGVGYRASRSTDNGATWSAPEDIRNLTPTNDPGRPAIVRYGTDRIFWAGRRYPFDDSTGDYYTHYSASKDGGEGFTYPKIYNAVNQNTYCSMIAYSATRIGALISLEAPGQASAILYYQEFTVA